MRDKSFSIKPTGIKAIIAVSFLLILFFVALFTGGSLPYMILYIYGFSMLFSFLWAIISVNILYTSIKVDKQSVVVGDSIQISMDIENPSFLPIPYVAIGADLLSDMLAQKHISRHISLGPRHEVSFEDILQCGHYGFYDMDSITLRVEDAFGIFAVNKRLASHLILRVYPKWYNLNRLSLSSYQQMGNISGKHRIMEDFADIGGIRQYRDGDSIKRVHWKLSAKRDELLVKDFVFNSNTQVCVIIDTYKPDFESNTAELSERMAECAASILYYCLNSEMHTGLIYDEREHVMLWGNNLSTFTAFMDSIIMTKMQGERPLSDVLLKDMAAMPWGTAVLVLVPLLASDTLSAMVSLKDMGYEIRCVYFGDKHDNEQANALAYLKECGVQIMDFSTNENASSALMAI
ncbi:DUF58 domain-containing protein [Mahella australiensis]|uniref:DUF58 domain-containing protein n=1 Tax=Mahella australiensis (strain DSM 15567 / CIP 107919 / 50-1 BON) TaxID=697281 RepID=F4A099_MAHA5|nr:DUF58 domain-containing protein [Mahella australiensis]AEE96933.1 protein of unknown function DUF58 [Mahella australiensis 50-1 BON]